MVSWIGEVDVAPLISSLDSLCWRPAAEEGCWAMAHEWPDSFPLEPVLRAVMAHYPGKHQGEVLISRVVPGQRILEHRDEVGTSIRVHVPLTTNPRALFFIDSEPFHMDVGSAYEINPRDLHSVANEGATDRIHLMLNVMECVR